VQVTIFRLTLHVVLPKKLNGVRRGGGTSNEMQLEMPATSSVTNTDLHLTLTVATANLFVSDSHAVECLLG
jgi:hypothetical protein